MSEINKLSIAMREKWKDQEYRRKHREGLLLAWKRRKQKAAKK